MVVSLCQTIGLQERASEELHVFYLNTKNDVIGHNQHYNFFAHGFIPK